MTRPSSKDRFRGCILGAAIGDALGAPYEFGRSGAEVATDGYRIGVFGTEPGTATDDSTLLRFHVNAWVYGYRDPQLRKKRYIEQLIEWYKTNPKDMGGQTRAAIRHYIDTHMAQGSPPDTGSCGNGSLMAVAPAGLMAWNPISAGQMGYNFSTVTHPNELCKYTCGTFSYLVYLASRTDRREEIPVLPVPSWFPVDGQHQGYVTIAAGLATEALRKVDNGATGFEALRWVIERGGDTDTNASISGALIGARYGMDVWAKPGWLVDGLADWNGWYNTADELFLLYERQA